MKNILVIPHSFSNKIKIREVEIAKLLRSTENNVYCISFGSNHELDNLFNKLKYQLSSVFKQISLTEKDQIKYIDIPYIFRPISLARKFNSAIIKKIAIKYKIDIIINSSFGQVSLIPLKNHNVTKIYDMVDFISENSLSKYIKEELSVYDKYISSSNMLTQFIKKNINDNNKKPILYLPNFADLKSIQDVLKSDVDKLKCELCLKKTDFTICYIGNHYDWGGSELLIKAFTMFNKKHLDSKLLIVGPGPEISRLKSQYCNNKSIIFTGPIEPSKVKFYFNMTDIGVLPFQKITLTDNALPIKVLEYTAANKNILATELNELKTHNFPNVDFVKNNVKAWEKALTDAYKKRKDLKLKDYKNVVQEYSSDKIKVKILEYVKND